MMTGSEDTLASSCHPILCQLLHIQFVVSCISELMTTYCVLYLFIGIINRILCQKKAFYFYGKITELHSACITIWYFKILICQKCLIMKTKSRKYRVTCRGCFVSPTKIQLERISNQKGHILLAAFKRNVLCIYSI